MQPTRRAYARRRPRPVRLVTPAHVARMPTIDPTAREALVTGLRFAELLAAHFPDFYAQRVRSRQVNGWNLLGVAGAFLSLAHTQLIAIDIEAHRATELRTIGWSIAKFPFAPKNPAHALQPNVGENNARHILAIDGAGWLSRPVPRAYGQGPDRITDYLGQWTVARRAIRTHMLALVIWRMVGHTRWARLGAEEAGAAAADRAVDEALGQRVAVLPCIPHDTPMTRLCAHLDRTQPGGLKRLGTFIAYLCARTGNAFADVTPDEATADYGRLIALDWRWPAESFAAPRTDQREAQRWANAYRRMAYQLVRQPDLVESIRQALLDGAAAVAGQADDFDTYDPRALIWRTR